MAMARLACTVRGLNDNHNKDVKNLFKSAAISASTRPGPLHDFYVPRVEKGMRPTVARLTLARRTATITLTMWKKGVDLDPQTLHRGKQLQHFRGRRRLRDGHSVANCP
jgi:hypothetical protein